LIEYGCEKPPFSELFCTRCIALRDSGLNKDKQVKEKRTLYSLCHTYAHFAMQQDRMSIDTLAKQMGTSVGMIEKHYSHLDAVKAMHQLCGDESRQLIEAVREVDLRYVYDETKQCCNACSAVNASNPLSVAF